MTDQEPVDSTPEQEAKKTPPRLESQLPFAGAPPRAGSGDLGLKDLDLDVDGIETRLPYGSEDIADK